MDRICPLTSRRNCLFDVFSWISLMQLYLSRMNSWLCPLAFLPIHRSSQVKVINHHLSVAYVRNLSTILDFSFLSVYPPHPNHNHCIRYLSVLPKYIFSPLLSIATASPLAGLPPPSGRLQHHLLQVSCVSLLPPFNSPCGNWCDPKCKADNPPLLFKNLQWLPIVPGV